MGLQLRGGFPSQTLDFATKQYVDTQVALATPRAVLSSPGVVTTGTKGFRLAQITCASGTAAGVQLRVGRTGGTSDLQGGWAEIDFSALGGGTTATAKATVLRHNTPAAGGGTFYTLQASAYVWELWYFPTAGIGDITVTQLSGNGVTYFGVDTVNVSGAPTSDMHIATDAGDVATQPWVQANAMAKLIPTVVSSGATLLADGTVGSTAASAGSPLIAAGIVNFSKYLHYQIHWTANSFVTPGTGVYIRGTLNGTPDASAVYDYSRSVGTGSTITFGSTVGATSGQVCSGNSETATPSASGVIDFVKVSSTARGQMRFRANRTNPNVMDSSGTIDYYTAAGNWALMDGFAMFAGTNACNLNFVVFGY